MILSAIFPRFLLLLTGKVFEKGNINFAREIAGRTVAFPADFANIRCHNRLRKS